MQIATISKNSVFGVVWGAHSLFHFWRSLTLVFSHRHQSFIPLKLTFSKTFCFYERKTRKINARDWVWDWKSIPPWTRPNNDKMMVFQWPKRKRIQKSFRDFSIEIHTNTNKSKIHNLLRIELIKVSIQKRKNPTLTLTPADMFITLDKMLWALSKYTQTSNTNMRYNTDYTAGLLALSLSSQSD